MAESNEKKNENILNYINKSISLIDSWVEFNRQINVQFQDLKEFGLSIINDFKESNHVNNEAIITSKQPITEPNIVDNNDTQDQSSMLPVQIQVASSTDQPNLNGESTVQSSNFETTYVDMQNNDMPESPSLIANHKNNSSEALKSAFEKLYEHINQNPLSDSDEDEEDDDEKKSRSSTHTKLITNGHSNLLSPSADVTLLDRYGLKNCEVVLERIDETMDLRNKLKTINLLKNQVKPDSDKEDAEIDNLCDIDNILKNVNNNSKETGKNQETKPNLKNDSQLNGNATTDEEKEEEKEEEYKSIDNSETEEENLNEITIKDLLGSIGLVEKPDVNENSKSDLSSDMDSNEEEIINGPNKKKKKETEKKNYNVLCPSLLMPTSDKSSDENEERNSSEDRKKLDKKNDKTKTEKQSDSNSIDQDKTIKSNDSFRTADEEKELEEIKETRETDQNTDASELSNQNNVQENDEDEVVTRKSKKYSSLRISSDENSSNEKDDSMNNDDNKSDSSESLIITAVETKRKKRRRIKKLKENESDLDSNTSKSNQSEVKKFNKNKRLKKKFKKEFEGDSSSNEKNDSSDSSVYEVKSEDELETTVTRHKLRNVIDDAKLAKETQDALNAEKERKKRIEEKKKIEMAQEIADKKEVFLNIDPKTKEGSVQVDSSLVQVLKDYQLEGVQFMWDCCFESFEMIAKPNNLGSGCLLAHCMGLGKTLQVITLVHTLIAHKNETKCKRVLILMPVNVLLNWKHEFTKWTAKCKEKIKVYDISSDRTSQGKDKVRQRIEELEKWYNNGGVFLMGYTIFSMLVQGKNVKPKRFVDKFKSVLTSPGPDLVICDEGHLLKNLQSGMAKAVNQIKTRRRVVLTGTPLQNNLLEYHCMVSFVKPNLLGTLKEFRNRFVNPINNGQHKDSTDADVRMMKKRAHVLHNALDGCVNRKDFSVIRKHLPPKNEYVLSIRLSEKQINLYKSYLVNQRGIENISNLGKVHGTQLFTDFQMLSRIWTHPWILKLNETRVQKNELKMAEKNFLVEEGEEEDDDDIEAIENLDDDEKSEKSEKASTISDDDIIVEDSHDSTTKKNENRKIKYKTRNQVSINGGGINDNQEESKSSETSPNPPEWWNELVTPECEFDLEISGKLVVFLKILHFCERIGDKLVVFSQSIQSLDIIEKFLGHLTKGKGRWIKNTDYFRIDGQVDILKRKDNINSFNNADNTRSRLFIISTKAGGIGINLIGANRCIVFDASWNPSFDTQSIFRIYRLGQEKEVYIYRFLSQGTMEEKIYQRQVTKQSLSQRVIDEHQLDRHFTSNELRELYAFEPDNGESEIPNMPSDELLKNLLLDCKKWIVRYHDHESLLENKIDEGLTEEDRKAAWEEYENERTNPFNANAFNLQMAQMANEQRNLLMSAYNNDLNSLNPNIPSNSIFYNNNNMLIPQNSNMNSGFIDLSKYQNHAQHSNSNGMNNQASTMHQNMIMPRQNTVPANYNNLNQNRLSNGNQSITTVNSNGRNSLNHNPLYHNIINNNNNYNNTNINNNNNSSIARNNQIGNSGFQLKELELRYRTATSTVEQTHYLNKIKNLDPLFGQKLIMEARNSLAIAANRSNQPRPNTNPASQMTLTERKY